MRFAAGALALVLVAACGSAPAPPPATAPAPPQAPPPDPRIAEMQVLLAELLDRLEVMNSRLQRLEAGAAAASSPEPSRPAPAPPPARIAPSPAAIGDAYRDALALFGKGRIDDAREAFLRIFEADPSGDLADNALYWIGETHYVQARWQAAIEIYRRLVSEYPDQNKAPDALLKMGLAYARLGDLILARSTLESLVQRYPYSTPAASARVELERLRY